MVTEVRDPITITMAEAQEACMDIIRPKLVPFLMSPPGVGKSDMARQLARKYKLFVIDIRLSTYAPEDLNGFPFIINPDKKDQITKAGYVPMDTFPIERDTSPPGYKGWLILLDEFNSAPLTVQAAAYKLILDKMVGQYRLHKNVVIIAAGNRMIDKAITNRIGTAMQSRVITLLIKVCNDAWHKWALTHNIDHRVIDFLKLHPDLLHDFNPDHQELTFACPRTWEFMSKIIKPWKLVELRKLAVMAGTVGEGAARQFLAYCEVYTHPGFPTIEKILDDPENCRLDDDPSIHYAVSGLVSHHMNGSNAGLLIKFLERLDIDFQVVAIRAGIAQDRLVKKTREYKKWVVTNSDELI